LTPPTETGTGVPAATAAGLAAATGLAAAAGLATTAGAATGLVAGVVVEMAAAATVAAAAAATGFTAEGTAVPVRVAPGVGIVGFTVIRAVSFGGALLTIEVPDFLLVSWDGTVAAIEGFSGV